MKRKLAAGGLKYEKKKGSLPWTEKESPTFQLMYIYIYTLLLLIFDQKYVLKSLDFLFPKISRDIY